MQYNPPVSHPRSQTGLSFGFFAGAAVWFAQLMINYAFIPQACASGSKLWIYITTGAAVLVSAAAGVWAYQNWTKFRQGDSSMLAETEAHEGYAPFVSLAGLLLSTVFFLLVLYTGISTVFLPACPIITMPMP